METQKLFTGKTEAAVWKQIEADLEKEGNVYDYNIVIDQNGRRVDMIIEIDLGGGFEGGYENTGFTAEIGDAKGFRFGAHVDGFIDDIGKFLGMQDVKVGYAALDKHVVIKTNDEIKAKALFADESVRNVFAKLEDFDFGIHLHDVGHGHEQAAFLELNIEQGITEPLELRKLYNAFYSVLEVIENFKQQTPIS